MKFKIPKEFQLAGYTYKVLIKPDIQTVGAHGMTRYDPGEIWLDSKLEPEDLKAVTFYHELFHAMFNTIGREDLKNDEAIVDLLGNLMWQYHKTAKY